MTTSNGCPSDAHGAAAYYLGIGWMPIPLPSRSKDPGRKGWQDLRPTVADLDALFPAGVERNVGVLLGEPSGGLIDVDLDTPEAVAAAPFLLPPTSRISGRPGKPKSHYWYLVDDPPRKATEKFLDTDRTDLLELRSTGGQTVCPPSLHEGTGEPIVWHSSDDPARVGLSSLRPAVLAVAAAAILARHWPAKGSRHDARLDLAGGLLRGGLSEDFATEFITAVCIAAGNQGVNDCAKVVQDTAAKLKAGDKTQGWPSLAQLLTSPADDVIRQTREWLGLRLRTAGAKPKVPLKPPEPYRPFPVDALPEPVRSYVAQAAASIGCDPVYVALPTLAVVASLIGNSRSIRLKRDWHEPSVIWAGIVGFSGTLKSPAFSAALRPLYRIQKQLFKKFKTDLAEYQTEKDAYDARKAQAKKDGKTFDEDAPEQPTVSRVVAGDTTIEKLAQLLEDNPKGLLVARDELGGWLSSFQRYKGKSGGTDLQNWLELHQAGTIQYDRKTGDRPVVFVQHASASVTGGIQPGVLAKTLTPEFMDAGLGARILLAMPPRRRKEWTEAEIDPLVREAYETLLSRLRVLELDKGDDGDKEPVAVKMTPEAKTVWLDFYRQWAREQAAVEGELAAAYSKLEGYAARLALIHHIVSRVGDLEDCQPIEAVSIEAGTTLVRWFGYETRRIYTALSETEDQRQIRTVVELMHSWGGMATVRKLQHASGARYKTADDAEAALQRLVECGLAEWVERPPGPKGGRPTRMCVLRTDITKTDKTPDDDDMDDDDFGMGVPTQPPDTTPPTSGIPPVTEGCVGSVVVSHNNQPNQTDQAGGPGVNGVVSEGVEGVLSEPSSHPEAERWTQGGPSDSTDTTDTTSSSGYRVVTRPDQLEMVKCALEETVLVALDTETTGLNPRTDRIRLLSLTCDTTTDGERFTYLIDCFAVDPRPLWDMLANKAIIIHNAVFDLGFLAALGFHPAGPVHDTMLTSQLLHGTRQKRGFHGLAQTAERELGRQLDKTEQKGDWSRDQLTPEQLRYAAEDAAVLAPLYASLTEKIRLGSMKRAAEIEDQCVPAMAWLAGKGMPFDLAAWHALADEAARDVETLTGSLDAAAPPRPGVLVQEGAWDWSSPKQVKEAFAVLGIPLESTDDDSLASVNHELARLLRDFRSAQKRTTTYGKAWPKGYAAGRIFAEWRQIGCVTGRMACSSPNLQNLPTDLRYRSCFAAPPGRVLIKADYSQIELRITAKISGDEAMLDAYAKCDDLHARTARKMLGKENITKDERKLAKPVNFGLIYGLGADSLRKKAKSEYGMDLTPEDARRYRAAFFNEYQGVGRWHRRLQAGGGTEIRTLGSRRVAVEADASPGKRANYIVQGTAGDGFKAALGLLWERRAECPDSFPVAVIHDEILVEAPAYQADAAKAWLTTAMVDGMAPLVAPVPVEVEAKVGRTWAGD